MRGKLCTKGRTDSNVMLSNNQITNARQNVSERRGLLKNLYILFTNSVQLFDFSNVSMRKRLIFSICFVEWPLLVGGGNRSIDVFYYTFLFHSLAMQPQNKTKWSVFPLDFSFGLSEAWETNKVANGWRNNCGMKDKHLHAFGAAV